MPRRVYVIIYDPRTKTFILGVKATTNLTAPKKTPFMAGFPQTLGGKVDQGTDDATLRNEINEESGGLLTAPALDMSMLGLLCKFTDQSGDYLFYVLDRGQVQGTCGANPKLTQPLPPKPDYAEYEMAFTVEIQLSLFTQQDTAATVAAKLLKALGITDTTSAQYKDFMGSHTLQALAAFIQKYA